MKKKKKKRRKFMADIVPCAHTNTHTHIEANGGVVDTSID